MTKHQTKPWYCSKNRVNAYRTILQDGGDPTVIQFLKVVRTILLNAIVGAIVWFSVASGGDPTLVPSIGLFTLSLINGFEYSDWAAFRQAYQETRENQ